MMVVTGVAYLGFCLTLFLRVNWPGEFLPAGPFSSPARSKAFVAALRPDIALSATFPASILAEPFP